MTMGLINPNPVVHPRKHRLPRPYSNNAVNPVDIFDHVRDIRDPEHPFSLEQLRVLSQESISVDDELARIMITFTPTVQYCSLVTIIGLCLRVKLKDCFPSHYKVEVKVSPGSHVDEEAVNKQLNDKERIDAALENPSILQLVDDCLKSNEF